MESPDRLAGRLQHEGLRTQEFFQNFPSKCFTQSIYSDGSCWNAQQILAHFVSSEKAFSLLIEDILEGGGGSPDGFNIDDFNEEDVRRLAHITIDDLLAEFMQSRERNVRLVEGLSSEDLARIGRHPYLGLSSMDEIIKMIYRHNQIHQRDLRRYLENCKNEIFE